MQRSVYCAGGFETRPYATGSSSSLEACVYVPAQDREQARDRPIEIGHENTVLVNELLVDPQPTRELRAAEITVWAQARELESAPPAFGLGVERMRVWMPLGKVNMQADLPLDKAEVRLRWWDIVVGRSTGQTVTQPEAE